MNKLDKPQSIDKKNSNKVSKDAPFTHRIKNAKGYTLYTMGAGRDRLDDYIKKRKNRIQKDT